MKKIIPYLMLGLATLGCEPYQRATEAIPNTTYEVTVLDQETSKKVILRDLSVSDENMQRPIITGLKLDGEWRKMTFNKIEDSNMRVYANLDSLDKLLELYGK